MKVYDFTYPCENNHMSTERKLDSLQIQINITEMKTPKSIKGITQRNRVRNKTIRKQRFMQQIN